MPARAYFYTKPMAPVIPQAEQHEVQQVEHRRPLPRPHPRPLLRLVCTDLRQHQTQRLIGLFAPNELLSSAVETVVTLLYPDAGTAANGAPFAIFPDEQLWPGTRSITLYLDNDDGVAYTTGMRLDNDHKEIHLSTKHAAKMADNDYAYEIRGVIVHEMVHCWQWNGAPDEDRGAPGGLIEGIADWVR
ncbi:MAG: hypothetical protein Q9162_002526 [Coniocarpon cinnabarinum]